MTAGLFNRGGAGTLDERDEQSLLSSMRGGDRAAAERLVEQTYSAVYAALHRFCGDRDLAADLTQETYRRAWEALAKFDGRSRISTWLFRIAYNTFLNHVRRPKLIVPLRRDDDDEPLDDAIDPSPLIDETLVGSEQAESLRRAVLGLPEDLRFTVTALFWAELSVRDVAELEGVTTVAIRKRMKRAFAALELELEEDPQ